MTRGCFFSFGQKGGGGGGGGRRLARRSFFFLRDRGGRGGGADGGGGGGGSLAPPRAPNERDGDTEVAFEITTIQARLQSATPNDPGGGGGGRGGCVAPLESKGARNTKQRERGWMYVKRRQGGGCMSLSPVSTSV